ncbi:MAG TPA: zf-HC2 domain-containing protein [Longimicrobiales bacterium]
MIRWLGHPAFAKLSRYADGELSGAPRERVAAHLVACGRCRDTIRFIRELGDAARRLPAPEPPADALPRLLARRAAGERVILPTTDPVPLEGERKRALPAIAAMFALFVAGTLLVSVPRLRADRSRLDFEPARPRAGQTIRVRYESGALLRSEPALVLRGRLRYRNGGAEILEVGRLTRGSDGTFHGSFSLPDSAVYGAFAVEDTAASRVDSNSRRLWELVVHDRDGRPAFEALRERTNDLAYRNWELAHETARMITRLYPDRAWGWRRLFAFERSLVEDAARDSLIRAYRERLRQLDRRSRHSEPTAEDAAALAIFATALAEDDIHRYWRHRLLREAPHHPTSIQFTLFDVQRRADADRRLAEYERLWNDGGDAHLELAFAALEDALHAGDVAAAYRWADRYVDLKPDDLGAIAETLAHSAPADQLLLDWLESSIDAATAGIPEIRDLHETAADYRRELNELAGTIHAALAHAYRSADRPDLALEHLVAAAEAGWNPTVFRAAARTFATAGNRTRAAEFLARIAIDPLTDSVRVAESIDLGRRWAGDVMWDQAVDRARDALARYANRYAAYRRIPAGLAVLGPGGESTTAGTTFTGHITLVVFWSPSSAPAVAALPDIARTSRLLRRHGIRTVGIYVGDRSERTSSAWNEAVPSTPLYFDPRFEIAGAFENWGTPEYFVVDRAGIIRFQHTTLDAAVRLAASLLANSQPRRLVAP